ncbi:hypothetical protein PTE30175_04208 [Pandoraea terrae]|uniref:Uncharacterized protein n=1 Tax=Pandoraea terrae TaxID=1537710 RepID=A0A5E4Y6T8_9BURK|nr:hypothetical protein [Pandoraea terrae]VVE44035.1 hypothetical protein PTE30175_04208 [Pandoraea terrae]
MKKSHDTFHGLSPFVTFRAPDHVFQQHPVTRHAHRTTERFHFR